MHQHLGIRIFLAQQFQFQALEFVVYDAGALPQQHVCAGLLLDIAAKMPVGRPEDFLTLFFQVVDDGQRARTGHHPVGARLHYRAGISVYNHRAIGVCVAKCVEFVNRTAQVQRTGGIQIRHEHGFFRTQDLGGFSHETHPGHDQRLRFVVSAKARHFQRIGNTTACGQRQILQIAVHVVMRHQHGPAGLDQFGAPLQQHLTFYVAQ